MTTFLILKVIPLHYIELRNFFKKINKQSTPCNPSIQKKAFLTSYRDAYREIYMYLYLQSM